MGTPTNLSVVSAALIGVASALLGAFPAAALVALVYGFPIPFVGKERGLDAVIPSQEAVVFYGVLGGFVVLALAGASAGAVAYRVRRPDAGRVVRLSIALSLLAALAATVFLAVLDLIIGPW